MILWIILGSIGAFLLVCLIISLWSKIPYGEVLMASFSLVAELMEAIVSCI